MSIKYHLWREVLYEALQSMILESLWDEEKFSLRYLDRTVLLHSTLWRLIGETGIQVQSNSVT